MDIAIFCADVGSTRAGHFGWAGASPAESDTCGTCIEEYAAAISRELKGGLKVAIGFECPLFVPVRDDPITVNSARDKEGKRPWSAGAGPVALATGLVEVLWVMNRVSRTIGRAPKASLRWENFRDRGEVLLWEAFVTDKGKGKDHVEDAQRAVAAFRAALPEPQRENAIAEERVLSLVGAAALWAQWSEEIAILREPCLVIRA